MDEEASLRHLASRLVEQVSGLTSLVCSMEEQVKALVQDNKLLRQQMAGLSASTLSPILSQSIISAPVSNDITIENGMFSLPTAPDSELDAVFISSPLSDPMIYEIDAAITTSTTTTTTTISSSSSQQSNEDICFEKMFDVIANNGSAVETPEPEVQDTANAVFPVVRSSRRFNRRSTGPLRILAVEDDPFCQHLIRHIVNSLNVGQVEIVADGVDAVINMSTGAFDLILMDIQLPRLDGLQAAQNIRKFNRRTPIVSMTSRVAEEDLKRYFEGGIDEVLPKPFDRQAVMRVIDQFFKLSLS